MGKNKLTIQELFSSALETYWSSERFKLSGHAKDVAGCYRRNIEPIFGLKKARKITKNDVREWHRSLAKTPFAANRSLEVLSTLFNKAIEGDIFDGANPCQFVKPFTERKRKRYATELEIQKIGRFLLDKRTQTDSPIGAVFLLTLLFTGARPRSLERARYSDLEKSDAGFGSLRFDGKSTHKTGEEEVVIFPPFIMDLLKELPARKDGLIFGIKLPKGLWKKVQEEVGCLDLWARDLRRTFATVGMSSGVKIDTISELLNHQSTQTTKIYAKLYNAERVLAVSDIADKMSALIKKKVG